MLRYIAAAGALALASTAAFAAPEIGAPAPAFEGLTTRGEKISLADFRGRNVVLEWTNHECPFVVKHYETGNMQKTQAAVKEEGAVWITVISSAPGKQGHVSAAEADALSAARNAAPDHVVLDPTGEIGMAYAAKTTPHMYVVDASGTLRYDGAIDDKPSTNHASVEGARNYVLAAFEAVRTGGEVAEAQTKPYGCSIKYP